MRKIIDFHVHIFPDELAPRAKKKLLFDAKRQNDARNTSDATADGTEVYLKQFNIEKAVVMPIATKTTQPRSINEWLRTIDQDFYYPFGAVHPLAEDAVEEVQYIKSLGWKGIKLHPGFQRFDVRSDEFYRVCEEARKQDLFILLHSGDERDNPSVIHGHPREVMKIYQELPGLKLIMAHYGCQRRWDLAEEFVIGKDVYIDVSHTLSAMTAEQAEHLIKLHDPDKILFGSDCPMQETGRAISFMDSLDLPEDLKDKIMYLNALRLLS